MFSVWEGATLLPRSVFDAIGGWGDPYFYAHEGIELAWRVWDQGKRTWYAGDLVANHPAIDPARHDFYYRLNARNRVWLAKRNLPWVLVPIYVGSWTGDPAAAVDPPTGGTARVVRRLGGGLAREARRPPGHQVGNGVADDARRPSTAGLMDSDCQGEGRRHAAAE